MKNILYARSLADAQKYLRRFKLNPKDFQVITSSETLEKYLRGIYSPTVFILDDHVISATGWSDIVDRELETKSVSSMNNILYTPSPQLAEAYLRHYSLDPSHFKVVTRGLDLMQALRGTTKNRVVILNDEPLDDIGREAIKRTKAQVVRVSY